MDLQENSVVSKARSDMFSRYAKIFENLKNLVWLDCFDTAIYLRKFRKDGKPSVGSIRNLIYRGKLKSRKIFGTTYLNREEIDRAVNLAVI